MKIFNGTPHAITIIEGAEFNPSIRKYIGGEAVLHIPSDGMLNAKISSTYVGYAGKEEQIPVYLKQFLEDEIDPLPEGYDLYIVSALYSAAAQKSGMDLKKIHTIADPVYTSDGMTILGCRGICPAF